MTRYNENNKCNILYILIHAIICAYLYTNINHEQPFSQYPRYTNVIHVNDIWIDRVYGKNKSVILHLVSYKDSSTNCYQITNKIQSYKSSINQYKLGPTIFTTDINHVSISNHLQMSPSHQYSHVTVNLTSIDVVDFKEWLTYGTEIYKCSEIKAHNYDLLGIDNIADLIINVRQYPSSYSISNINCKNNEIIVSTCIMAHIFHIDKL